MDDGVLHMKYKYSGDAKRKFDQLPRLAVRDFFFFKLWKIFVEKRVFANVHMKSENIEYGLKPTHHTVVVHIVEQSIRQTNCSFF